MTTQYLHGTKDTALWFSKAKPEPTPKDLSTQTGVHLEEVAEFIRAISHSDKHIAKALKTAAHMLEEASDLLKKNEGIILSDPLEVLDGLADQIVTAVGTAHCAGMNIVGALNEVNRSNFSKFDSNGNPILDNNRKIIKGPDYSKPDLTPFL